MSDVKPLDVVFCWHMHQPQYSRVRDGRYWLPWTYLHAIKDYADMAWHLEQVPGARAVVNFTPILLEQLDDYVAQFAANAFRDPLLQALAEPQSIPIEDRPRTIEALFRANRDRLIGRYAPYVRLRGIFESAQAGNYLDYLSADYVGDLAVWYHLAWLGETIARADIRAKRLRDKTAGFDAGDRASLLGLIGDTVKNVVPRYRALAAKGRIELSTSPYAHPILPLLLDFASARESMPDAVLPSSPAYPGGSERAVEHLHAAAQAHRQRFGSNAAGCWPSEGAVSKAAVELIAGAGFAWTASCESVLVRSLQRRAHGLSPRSHYLYKPYRIGGGSRSMPCFFRDVHLSDLIGFRYAHWHGDDAVANFVSELEAIAAATAEQPRPVVSIILDGENAWEHYPENAYYFLAGLYRAVASNPRLRMTTFSEYLSHEPSLEALDKLDPLVAGSWVYGTLSTWIGDPDKNRAWDLLVRAKTDYDGAIGGDSRAGNAEHQLKVCEGSDWFWWFGDYNPAQTVSDFDRLFRDHVRDLYVLLNAAPPPEVDAVLGTGSGSPVHGGTMRENPAFDNTAERA